MTTTLTPTPEPEPPPDQRPLDVLEQALVRAIASAIVRDLKRDAAADPERRRVVQQSPDLLSKKGR